MCKIFGITNTKKLDMASLKAMVTRAHTLLTATQRDGWGFAIGNEYAEKWDRPTDWVGAGDWPSIQEGLGGLPVDVDCLISGEFPATSGKGFIAHARTATCARGAVNAHPHFSGDWVLVHNGVVESRKKVERSCDSMLIAESMEAHQGASGLAEDLSGYLAILGFDPNGRFFALRDNRAPLYVAKVPTLGAFAFASTPELLQGIVGQLTPKPVPLLPFHYCIENADGGWDNLKVDPWSSSAPLSNKATTAFGDYGKNYGTSYGKSYYDNTSKGSGLLYRETEKQRKRKPSKPKKEDLGVPDYSKEKSAWGAKYGNEEIENFQF